MFPASLARSSFAPDLHKVTDHKSPDHSLFKGHGGQPHVNTCRHNLQILQQPNPPSHAFRACQVHEVQLADADGILAVWLQLMNLQRHVHDALRGVIGAERVCTGHN